MNINLNQNLYSRFGLMLDVDKVQNGCKMYFEKLILSELDRIIQTTHYENHKELKEEHDVVFNELCRQMFLDSSSFQPKYYYDSELGELIIKEISSKFRGSFNEYLLRLQILLDTVDVNSSVDLDGLAEGIEMHLKDFPILGIGIKKYKKKGPQIIPSTSKIFEVEVKNTLGLLEADTRYEHVLPHFESGLKEFLLAKDRAAYKDAIEDMYTACDELVKAVLGNNQKGFRHVSEKEVSVALKLNGHQKELYKNLRSWMDEIKHGTLKKFDRTDTEMIISLIGALIRFIINNQK